MIENAQVQKNSPSGNGQHVRFNNIDNRRPPDTIRAGKNRPSDHGLIDQSIELRPALNLSLLFRKYLKQHPCPIANPERRKQGRNHQSHIRQ